ncbi:MAG: RnfABCDGE type electron transport complex subunit B [Ruminococcus sp.]
MDFTMILIAVGIVAGIGLIIGLVLAIASCVMAVPTDKKVEALNEALPGANCGACGYSGCEGYAKALASGEAAVGKCAPGGNETAKVLSEILGTGVTEIEPMVAVVRCMGNNDNTEEKYSYQGTKSCAAAASLHGGKGSCKYGCLGFGDCVSACPYDAVSICNGVALVNKDLCKGCAVCVRVCPKNIISLVPKKSQAVVRCSNRQKGGEAKTLCKAACIGCKRCEKVCEAGAIKVESFKASVDPSKCTGCKACVEVCTMGSITELI